MGTKKYGPHGKYCGCNPDGVYVGMGCPNPNRPLQVTKQTAVEWLIEYMIENFYLTDGSYEAFKTAKQMEKEQILEALNYDCYRNEYPENYYEERYGKEEF